MKDDEARFLVDVFRNAGKLSPRDIIGSSEFYIHLKRAGYLLDKWTGKGWYDYGVSLDLGWLTPSGHQKAEEIYRRDTDGEVS